MFIDWTRFSSILLNALEQGAIINPPKVNWDVSLHCENPYEVCIESFPHVDWRPVQTYDYTTKDIRRIYLDTPCRKCPTCLRNRSRLWAARAKIETMRATRTWMVTLTINPEHRFRFSLIAGSRDYIKSYSVISKEVTKMLKRLRKSGHKFRYLCIAEAHKDGYPHIHMLVHEGFKAIPKREIQKQWPYGFTTVKLVDSSPRAARYVTKYMAKDMNTRVRASQKYGKQLAVCELNGSDIFTFSNSSFMM